ncbi:acyl-CoA synthetase [Enemella sp. A6]|uniref:acyl-CoA synthetase n=1 Tax=Enemella sp. A6 TaxID=3440152 RepID=UPI003EBAE74D
MTLNLASLYEAVAAAIPDRIAVICNDVELSYADLDRRANRVANHLIAAGITPGEHVGLHAQNSLAYVESLLGVLKARAVPININYRYTGHELQYLFADADLVAVIASGAYAPHSADLKPQLPKLRHIMVVADEHGTVEDTDWPDGLTAVDYETALAEAGDTTPPTDQRSADDLFILYTGGTTGMPKGVVWRHEDFYFAALVGGNRYGPPHRSAEALVAAAVERTEQMVNMVSAPLMHGAAMYAMLTAFYSGSKVVLLPRFDALDVLRRIDRHGVNVVQLVGDATARPIVDAIKQHPGEFDLSSVRVLGSGGAILSPSVQDDLRAAMPQARVATTFGSSETGADGALEMAPDGTMRMPASPTAAVLNDRLEPVSVGTGELGFVARRGHVPLRYYNAPEKSAATFPVIDGERWSIVGDLAEVATDGTIIIHGRGSGTINSGGEKVFPEEVEQALKAHPGVMDCLVAGVADARFGERVGAVVELRPEAAGTDPEEIRQFCRGTLAGYKVPAVVKIVDAVLRSPTGKADYRWAKRQLNP